MLGNVGTPEIIILLVIVLLIFGPKNLPRLAQSIGRSARELKNGLSGIGEDLKDTTRDERRAPSTDTTPRRPDGTPVDRGDSEKPHSV